MNWRVGMNGVGQSGRIDFQGAGGSELHAPTVHFASPGGSVGPVPLSKTAVLSATAAGVGTWGAAVAAKHLVSAPTQATAPHRALLSRMAAVLPVVDKAAMLRLLPYARWAAATNPVTFIGLTAATFALDRWLNRPTGTSATAHLSVPVVEPPKVVAEIYPAHQGPERLQGLLVRPDHLPDVLRGGLEGRVVIRPEPQADIHAGTRAVPMNPTGVDGYKQYVTQPGEYVYLSAGRGDGSGDQSDPHLKNIRRLEGDLTWAQNRVQQIIDPQALRQHNARALNDAIDADPNIVPVNIAENIQVYGVQGRPHLKYMTYEPDLMVNQQAYEIQFDHLDGFNRHGLRAYYDTQTGHVDIWMNSGSPVVHRADEILGSDEKMMTAYLEKMALEGKPVNSISVRPSLLQTDAGRGYVDEVRSTMDFLTQARGADVARQYANQVFQTLGERGLLGSVDVLLREQFSILDVKSDQFGENWLHFIRD